MATFVPVAPWVPNLTLPKDPTPRVLPMLYPFTLIGWGVVSVRRRFIWLDIGSKAGDEPTANVKGEGEVYGVSIRNLKTR